MVLALNYDTKRELLRLGARRVIVMPNAIINFPDRVESVGIRSPSTVRDGVLNAIWAGRMLDWKGACIAVEAVAANAINGGWLLDLYGDGPERERISRLIARRNLQGSATIHQPLARDEFVKCLATYDVLLFTSLHDSCGWVAAEAAALGKPVLAFAHGGAQIVASSNFHAIDPSDPLKSINQTMADISNISENDRGIRIDWSSDRIGADIRAIYAEVLSDDSTNQKFVERERHQND
ncbi:glycosyltransferase [Gordonia rhizosphera]|uniref:glycosyltransferase n=1 Tax=Gordonia rhizosphera TaxID=83341 RepID=UPI0012F6662D|nr:glycosyltransferase [Gordonia rhizosphera]